MQDKAVIDEKGYIRGDIAKSDLISRQIAYKYIYQKNREEYPLPFSLYQVHHIDGNKLNNDPSNLQILTRPEHELLHSTQQVKGKSKLSKQIEHEIEIKRAIEEIKEKEDLR